MGAVYESQDPKGGEPLAIKMLAVDFVDDEQVKARFLNEGRVCQRLIHPNIVRVFDVATAEDGTPYIVMELLSGVPLSAYTRAGVRVPMGQAASILQGILAGLSAAHAQGIVHRDLKPENVFLARDPAGTFTAKLVDFGIAKVMDAAGGMGSKTRTGALLGTPAYMSPEQIRNAKDVDARADLWSAGVMLYEMLTGRVAFPAPTEYARLAAVLNTQPPRIETVDPQFAPLAAFVAQAMEKDRAVRFQTGLEMARALAATTIDAPSPLSPRAPPALSRLPDVPSVLLTSPGGATVPASLDDAAASALAPPTAHVAQAPRIDGHPGGTLSSAGVSSLAATPGSSAADGGVAIAYGSNGTLPSENLPMLRAHGGGEARGVAMSVVLMLIAAALAVGFLLGFLAAQHL